MLAGPYHPGNVTDQAQNMTTIRTLVLLLCFGLTPAIADEASCTNCYQEGFAAYQRGELDRAANLFERGCEQGGGESCNAAAHMYGHGQGVAADSARAISFGLRSCDLGFWQGCYNLGASLVGSDDAKVAAKGHELLMRGCEGGHGPSCTKHGASFFAGEGTDPARARSLVKRACDAGDAKGCGFLGGALRDGIGGPVDVAAANQYLERACDGGSMPFCNELAVAYHKGTGDLEADVERAAELFKQSCDGGWQNACDNLELIAKAAQKKPSQEQNSGWSISGENVTFSSRKASSEDGPSMKTTVGSMQVGQGDETATFSDVRSSCGMLELTVAFSMAAPSLRQCLTGSETRRVTLGIKDGRVTSSSVDPDDTKGRCAIRALAAANIQGLACSIEASVSRQ
jgi:TPR repeat protein